MKSVVNLIIVALFQFMVLKAQAVFVDHLGTYNTGIFDESAAEIVSYDKETGLVFFINSHANQVVSLDISNPHFPIEKYTIDVDFQIPGGIANCVAVYSGLVAVAVASEMVDENGSVVFYNAENGAHISTVEVGVLPDNLQFSYDGSKVITADEGEPSSDYSIDPEGTVSVIEIIGGNPSPTATIINFNEFDGMKEQLINENVRIFGGVGESFSIDHLSTYETGIFDESAAEIIAYDSQLKHLFFVNANANQIVALNLTQPATPVVSYEIDIENQVPGGTANCVAVHNGLVAIAVASSEINDNGYVVFYDGETGLHIQNVEVGVLPDNLQFSPNGGKVVTANEGEPSDDYLIDPLGSVSIIDIDNGVPGTNSTTIDFTSYDSQVETLKANGVRIFGKGPDINVAASGLFFSEYAEGSSNHKYLEIFNGTGSAVDLTNYSVSSCNNGCNAIDEFDYPDNISFASGTVLENGDVYIIAHPSADASILDEADQTFTYLSNGDDFFALTLAGATADTYTIIDKIGDFGDDPGSGWDVAGTTNGTKDHTLKRKSSVTSGNIDWSGSSGSSVENSEWEVLDQNTWTHLGAHIATGSVGTIAGSALPSKDLEPEYIAISPDGNKAYVAFQENNALAIVDLQTANIENIKSFGLKNHSLYGNEFDASDKDNQINIVNHPTLGMYQPDAIKAYSINGQTYLFSANEGDARDYDGYSEETRVKDLTLDPVAFPNASTLQDEANLGRLKTTTANGDIDGDGDHDVIYSYGARSFSIWDEAGNLVWDSGNQIETILVDFYNDHSGVQYSFDSRSDDKGPEPEAVEIGQIGSKTYAFVGLERASGFMVYDVSNPTSPEFITYNPGATGDIAPESIVFISASESPTNQDLLAVSNEVSGTVSIYKIGPEFGTASVSQDLEPEYVAITENGSKAYIALQENNAFAIVDLFSNQVIDIVSLGYKDHSLPGNGYDPTDKNDGFINIAPQPTLGMYQPDAIKAYEVNGLSYIVTANEGDARDYDGYSEETRVKDLTLDPEIFPSASYLQEDQNLGRLKTTLSQGDIDGDGDHDVIYSYGARSFSIWDENGHLIWDSGNQIEMILKDFYPDYPGIVYSFDSRSDDKGPEPEAVEISYIDGQAYAFIGLERSSGFLVYNITDPYDPEYLMFHPGADGDIAPESIVFISKTETLDVNVLAVSNEVSGSVSFYSVNAFHPTVTPTSAMAVSKIRVYGEPAGAEDYIVAKDQEGRVVGASEISIHENESYINLQIYGDDPSTPEKDGMFEGEKFTLHLYDASEKKLLAGESDYVWMNTNGAPLTDLDDPNNIISFPVPFLFTATPTSGLALGQISLFGESADPQDWIAAIDSEGNCVGAGHVTVYDTLSFINLQIYGDDPSTPEKDGMFEGESFTFHLYDVSEGQYLESQVYRTWENTNGAPISGISDSDFIFVFPHPFLSFDPGFEPTPLSAQVLGKVTINGEYGEQSDIVAAYQLVEIDCEDPDFDGINEQEECVSVEIYGVSNFVEYNDMSYINIQVYGDDPATLEKDGLLEGELFNLGVYDASKNNFEIIEDFEVWTNTNGAPLEGYSDPEQIIAFPIPFEIYETPASAQALGQIVQFNDVVEQNDWMAAVSINNDTVAYGAGKIIENEGLNYFNFQIYGDDPETEEIDGMVDNEEFYLVFYDASNGSYEFSQETFIWTNTNGSPLPDLSDPSRIIVIPAPFGGVEPTPSSALIVGSIQVNGLNVSSNSFLSAFGSVGTGGVLAGQAQVFNQEGVSYFVMQVYGDDPETEEIDGLIEGEEIYLSFYDPLTGHILSDLCPVATWTNTNGAPLPEFSSGEIVITFSETNNRPCNFDLVGPADGSQVIVTETNLDQLLTVSWSESVDPDNDVVSYSWELYDESDGLFIGEFSSLSDTQLDIEYQTIYQILADLAADTLNARWDVYATDGVDTTYASNGPFSAVFIRENFGPSSIELLLPEDYSEIAVGSSNINDVLNFSWTQSFDPDGDDILYDWVLGMTYYYEENDVYLSAEGLSDTSYSITYQDLYTLLDTMGVDTLYAEWDVFAYDSDGYYANSSYYFDIKIFKENTAPNNFDLISPESGTMLTITNENLSAFTPILWTESIDWDEENVTYTWWLFDAQNDTLISYVDSLNNGEGEMQIEHQAVYDAFLEAEIDSFDYTWTVTAHDGQDSTFAENGPFALTIINGINVPPSEFSLLTPEDGSTIIIDEQTSLTGTQEVTWESSTDDGRTIIYLIEHETNVGQISFIPQSTEDNTFTISFSDVIEELNTLMLTNPGLSYFEITWNVRASDGIDTTASLNGPFTFTIDAGAYLSALELASLPEVFELHQNYPNPFNPNTAIRYDVSENDFVSIQIFDVVGRKVKTLLNSNAQPGRYSITWNGTNDYGEPVSAGMYFYQMRTSSFQSVKKLILMK